MKFNELANDYIKVLNASKIKLEDTHQATQEKRKYKKLIADHQEYLQVIVLIFTMEKFLALKIDPMQHVHSL